MERIAPYLAVFLLVFGGALADAIATILGL